MKHTHFAMHAMKPPTRSDSAPLSVGSSLVSASLPRAVRIAAATIGLICFLISLPVGIQAASAEFQCRPTPPDSLGPFYEPDAPERQSVGNGYWLTGFVRSAQSCRPISGARVELWMAGPDGDYSDDFRATVYAKEDGAYRFQSHHPTDYAGRPPHIHIRVSADGFQTLVTQHYPSRGAEQGDFDLVLLPLP